MDLFGRDGIELVLRWFHVVAVITWIGHAYFFNWLDKGLRPVQSQRDGEQVEGELWMVHSGGFYRVEKIAVAPERMPEHLHWFKWEAALTWLSGFFLLHQLYHHGAAILLDADSPLGPGLTGTVGVLAMLLGWLVYDTLCRALGDSKALPLVGFGLILALSVGLDQLMSGRAAYIHVGAVLGTIMVANVWVRIIPAQNQLLSATAQGVARDASLGLRAKQRSIHNNYLSLPIIFIMISNHSWGTFGHRHGWAILGLLTLAGAGVRHLMNRRLDGKRMQAGVVVLVVAAFVGAGIVMRPAGDEADDDVIMTDGGAGSPSDGTPQGSGTTGAGGSPGSGFADGPHPQAGTVQGTVTFVGLPPEPSELMLSGECVAFHDDEIHEDSLLVRDGRVQNAFVWLGAGVDPAWIPAPPEEAVSIDQSGCRYAPRVIGVRVRQPVTFLNSDPLLHNVHGLADVNREFNIGMPASSPPNTRVFKKPEIMLPVRCDVHPWMSASIGVVEHPWFAVTDAGGGFALTDVPPGAYTLEIWHEVLGRSTQQVELAPDGSVEVQVVFQQ